LTDNRARPLKKIHSKYVEDALARDYYSKIASGDDIFMDIEGSRIDCKRKPQTVD
jgi:hypothetical protein